MQYRDELSEQLASAGEGMLGRLTANLRDAGPAADALGDIPPDVFDGVDTLKLNRANLPPKMGGLAILQSSLARCLLMEALGHADAALASAMPGPGLALPPILGLGTAEQQDRWLTVFQKREPAWAAFAITEPGGGSAASRLSTTAKPSEGGFVLEGTKCLIGSGSRASFFVVFASTEPDRGQFGISPLIVDADSEGLEIIDRPEMLGLRALRVSTLRFRDCWVPGDQLLAGPDGSVSAGSFLAAQRTWDYMRPSLSALVVGAVERLLETLTDASGSMQSATKATAAALVSRRRAELGSVRLLTHRAAALWDEGDDSSAAASLAKMAAANLASEAVRDGLHFISKVGAKDASEDIQRWTRDFQAFELMEGTTEVQQLMLLKSGMVRARRLRPISDNENGGIDGTR